MALSSGGTRSYSSSKCHIGQIRRNLAGSRTGGRQASSHTWVGRHSIKVNLVRRGFLGDAVVSTARRWTPTRKQSSGRVVPSRTRDRQGPASGSKKSFAATPKELILPLVGCHPAPRFLHLPGAGKQEVLRAASDTQRRRVAEKSKTQFPSISIICTDRPTITKQTSR